MRISIVALGICGMFATAAQAADGGSAVVVQLPDTASNLHVYLFTLKPNKIVLAMTAEQFCTRMDYGEVVLFSRPDETGKDNKVGPGALEWVICKFKGK
jgi:hypothetical protein